MSVSLAQPYSSYISTGIEWLSKIPCDWEMLEAKRIFYNRRESSRSGDDQLAASQQYGVVPQSLMMSINDARVMLALKGTSTFRHVESGDFVISLRSFEGGIEYSAYKGCVSPAYTVLASHNKLDSEYFTHLLKSGPFVAALQSTTNSLRDGKAISFSQFGSLRLPLPPLNEQTQIAKFLDYETGKMDALIEKQQQLIRLLKEKRQAVISHAVTKGLNPAVPMRDSGIEWLGEVPAHWEVKKLRYFAQVLRGKFTHRPRNDPAFYDGNFPFVQTGNITRASKYITTYHQTLNARGVAVSKKFPKGTLVMAIAANIGDVAILDFPAYFPDSVVGLLPNRTSDVMFMYYMMQAMKQPMLQRATISTQMNLNIDQISWLSAACPPIKEQCVIVEMLDGQLEQMDALHEKMAKTIIFLQERRTALISAAVTGKIDVRNWKPPAPRNQTETP